MFPYGRESTWSMAIDLFGYLTNLQKTRTSQIIPGWNPIYDPPFNTCFDWPRDVFVWHWVKTVVKWGICAQGQTEDFVIEVA